MLRHMQNNSPLDPRPTHRASLFKNGRNQAVRIPRDMELPGDEVIMHRDGDRLIIEPVGHVALLDALAGLPDIEDELPEIEDTLPEPVDL